MFICIYVNVFLLDVYVT